jgi:hypothetical protein
MHAPVRMAGISWSDYCDSQYLDVWRATKTRTMPSGCAAIRRCVGGRQSGTNGSRLPRPARWAEWLIRPGNFATLVDRSGQWIDTVHMRRPPRIVVHDMGSSESPTYGGQEGGALTTDTSGAPATTRCSYSTSLAICSDARYGQTMSTRPTAGVAFGNQLCRATVARGRGYVSAATRPLPTQMSTSSSKSNV